MIQPSKFATFNVTNFESITLGIVNGVIKDWGCDCVFFFNYSRINAGISNPSVTNHIDALFGKDRADSLRSRLPDLTPAMREALILEELAQAIKEMGGKYVLPFRFKNASGKRTSHSLVFVSKSFKGYAIMKDIMARESSTEDQGVPSLTYSPADASMPLLFSLQRPLDELKASLVETYAGQELSVQEIFEKHSVDTQYILKNYRETLMQLDESGMIGVRSLKNSKKRRKGTFANHLLVKFPKGEKNGE